MRRLAITGLAALAAAGLAGAALADIDMARSRAVVRLKSCSLEKHTAVFYGRMRRVRGTGRMGMRFTLLERPGGVGRFQRVRAPGLGRWRKSTEGVRAFGYRQGVRGLDDGSSYRMLVRYRWYGTDHKVLRHARRSSRVCRMFLLLPNLRVRILDARPTATPGKWRYDAEVTNAGHALALNVNVQLSVDGVARTRTIAALGAGEARSVSWSGPVCKGQYSALVDPDNTIAESDETDNGDTVSCPTVVH